MRVEIKSKQNYGTHQEEIIEQIQGDVAFGENEITIDWPEGHIIIEENRIIQERNANKLVIEAGKVNFCNYETEHGSFEMKIVGIEVEKLGGDGVLGKAKYALSIAGAEPYVVEAEIIVKSEE